jgi:hypothetical protein
MTGRSFVAQRPPGTETDLGPFLNVVTWILLITSALAVLTRLVTKKALKRRIDIADAFVVAALVRLYSHSSVFWHQRDDGVPIL